MHYIRCFYLPTRSVTLSQREFTLIWHNIFLTNLCWLLHISYFSQHYRIREGNLCCFTIDFDCIKKVWHLMKNLINNLLSFIIRWIKINFILSSQYKIMIFLILSWQYNEKDMLGFLFHTLKKIKRVELRTNFEIQTIVTVVLLWLLL